MMIEDFQYIRKSLLRNIRILQNLGNEFAHAFATCTRPSRLGLEVEAKYSISYNFYDHHKGRVTFGARPGPKPYLSLEEGELAYLLGGAVHKKAP